MLQVPATHSNLNAIIDAHLRAERIRGMRALLVYLLALSGGLCWIVADRPGMLSRLWNLAIVISWPVIFAVFLVVVVFELKWDLRITELMRLDRGAGSPGEPQ